MDWFYRLVDFGAGTVQLGWQSVTALADGHYYDFCLVLQHAVRAERYAVLWTCGVFRFGCFFAIHAINLSASDTFFIPLSLVPLVGGIAGLTFGILFGYVTTKRSGTTFSMISLGIVELVFACSLMFPGFFGGEGGVSGNRVFGKALMGVSFGPQIQVYYLIAAWLFISTVAMFAISHTPLGRIANAVRDNPERAEFIGYDTQRVRYLMLILSGFLREFRADYQRLILRLSAQKTSAQLAPVRSCCLPLSVA